MTEIIRTHQKEVKPKMIFSSGDADEKIGLAVTIPSVKVKVNAPFRVVHDGTAYVGGDEFDVPADDTTNLWVRAGWVERVTKKGTK